MDHGHYAPEPTLRHRSGEGSGHEATKFHDKEGASAHSARLCAIELFEADGVSKPKPRSQRASLCEQTVFEQAKKKMHTLAKAALLLLAWGVQPGVAMQQGDVYRSKSEVVEEPIFYDMLIRHILSISAETDDVIDEAYLAKRPTTSLEYAYERLKRDRFGITGPRRDAMLRSLQSALTAKTLQRLFLDAVRAGDVEAARALLENPIVDPTADNEAAINIAYWNDDRTMVALLKTWLFAQLNDVDASPEATSLNKFFLEAVDRGDVEEVRLLLQNPQVDPATEKNKALITASWKGDAAMVALLQGHRRVKLSELYDMGRLP